MTAALAPDHTRDIAARAIKADDDFVAQLVQFGAISKADAEKVFALYRRKKWVKRDLWFARWSVTHGGFLDRDVIGRALDLANTPAKPRARRGARS